MIPRAPKGQKLLLFPCKKQGSRPMGALQIKAVIWRRFWNILLKNQCLYCKGIRPWEGEPCPIRLLWLFLQQRPRGHKATRGTHGSCELLGWKDMVEAAQGQLQPITFPQHLPGSKPTLQQHAESCGKPALPVAPSSISLCGGGTWDSLPCHTQYCCPGAFFYHKQFNQHKNHSPSQSILFLHPIYPSKSEAEDQ